MRYPKTIMLLSTLVSVVCLVVPLVTRAATTVTASNNGLVGYWSFDEGKGATAYDYSGNKNTGVLSGTPKPAWLNGVLSKGLALNGTSIYVNAGNKASLQNFNDITISAWVKFNSLDYTGSTGGLRTILIKGYPDSAASTTGFWLSYDNRNNGHGFGYTCFGNSNGGFAGGGNNFSGYNYTFSNNVWYYISVTIASSQAKLYINGVQLGATKTFSNLALSNLAGSLNIGRTSFSLDGAVDEVRLYTRALSDTEIANLYKVGAAKANAQSNLKLIGLDSGLVGYYTMDNQDINWTTGKMIDKSGATTTAATLVGLTSATSTVAGKFSQAVKMISSSTYIVAPPASVGISKSVSTWVYQTGPTISYTPLVEQGSGDTYGNFRLIKDGNRVAFGYENNINSYYVTASIIGVQKKWYHIVGVYNGAAVKIYVNGVAYSVTQSLGNYGSWNVNTLNIGYRPYTSSVGGWNGLIDETRVYNRALSATEVKQLYNQGAGTKINSQPVAKPLGLDAGLVGYWTMNNQDINWTTKTVIDKSGNSNTGTLANMTATSSPIAGKIGQALKFNGSNNYILNNQIVNITKSTVSAWVYLPSYPTSGSLAILAGFAQGNNSATHDKDLFIDGSGKAYYYTYTGASKCTTEPVAAVPRNSWHLLIGTNDGVNNYLYIDGVQVGSVAAGNSFASYGAANILIGGIVNYSGSVGCGTSNTTRSYLPANTKIDDVRVYNRALSAAEVKQLFNQGK